jgi:hypothetical protein
MDAPLPLNYFRQGFRFAILATSDYTSNRNNQSRLFHFLHLKRLQRACFDCGGEVTVSPDTQSKGVCVNCGPVGIDVMLEVV